MSTVYPLHGNQMKAVEPHETVWLSASAGTGKTQVLSSRVLRLMLQPGVEPSAILCLTFTKAGATEMAARIKERLARWVRAKEADLAKELQAIGADFGPKSLARARTLFAKVLDCPGGGLRIDTIHAFSQWLLAAFPHEAGLIPGTRPMEDRERAILARQVLADLLVDAEQAGPGNSELADALADLSLRMGPDAVEGYLLRCAQAREAWFGLGAFTSENMRERVLALLGLPSDADAHNLAAMCADATFDVQSLRRCMEINAGWSAKTGQEGAAQIGAWLAGDEAARIGALDDLAGVFLKKDGEPRASSSQSKIDPSYPDYCARVIDCIARVRERKILLALAERLIPALRLGRAFALKWEEAKQREGVIDFDDQIRQAAALLGESQLAEWIRYKLDRRFDHILVDEAQDTNRAQWDIIFALAEEFWAGLGQHDDVMRTLFVVGDYKQAIFRFQGTNPQNFAKARDYVFAGLAGAVENVRTLRSNQSVRPLREYGLDRSFRSSQPVLDFVDAAITQIGHERFGLSDVPESHVGWDRAGHVVLWRPVGQAFEAEEPAEDADEDNGNWFSKPDRQMAENIARQVREWLDESAEGFFLAGKGRRARPGDVMVLVRKRRDLAGLIVARLHAHRVPVAGVDRLRIGEPLAVRDLLAALRFAAQPLDDLNLAALLVSPLIGWSQEDLLRFGYREPRVRLWNHLRAMHDPNATPALERLLALLARADFEPPHHLLTWLLTGPWEGRRKLVARLGREANDPIDELVNAAHAYAAVSTPSLVGFLQWFDAGDGELKREADGAGDLVRVMTVHGSKGLQAPIVILADATGDPDSSRTGGMTLPDPTAPERRAIPLPALRKEERIGRIADHFEKERREEMEEHWRLLYVAMTRAEEALFIGGALGSRDRGVPPAESWYTRLRELFPTGEELADPIWAGRLEWGQPAKGGEKPAAVPAELPFAPVLPQWLNRPAPQESRPPKPLAPSNLGEDEAPELPYPPGAGTAAARRGTLTHKLLERMPAVPLAERQQAGARWLERNGADLSAEDRADILSAVLAVLSEPDWAPLFAPGSLAEVPVAATVGERVIAGTIDRLLIEEDRVLIVDFKTSRRAPETVSQIPGSILRQMAAYCAAVEKIFPGRRVEAALLYTAVPRLFALPANVLESHKSGLT